MQKIWKYLAIGLAFFSAGLIVMRQLIGAQTKVVVRKIKNKRTSGDNAVTIPINLPQGEKLKFKERVNLKKIERQKKRGNRKSNKK